LTVVHLQAWLEKRYILQRPESELRQKMFDIMILNCLGKPVPLQSHVLQNICSEFPVVRSMLPNQSSVSPDISNLLTSIDPKILAMSFWYEVFPPRYEILLLTSAHLGTPSILSSEFQNLHSELLVSSDILSFESFRQSSSSARHGE